MIEAIGAVLAITGLLAVGAALQAKLIDLRLKQVLREGMGDLDAYEYSQLTEHERGMRNSIVHVAREMGVEKF
jgi:hypothetical protein